MDTGQSNLPSIPGSHHLLFRGFFCQRRAVGQSGLFHHLLFPWSYGKLGKSWVSDLRTKNNLE